MTRIAGKNAIRQDFSVHLSNEEIEDFAFHGYVVKANVLDPALMRRAVDVMWSKMPPHFERNNSSTWRGKITDCSGAHSIGARDGKVKLREEIWGNTVIDEMVTYNEHIIRMIEQLVGPGSVVAPEQFRGLYPIFPTPEYESVPVFPHVDFDGSALPFKVGIAAYLEDVPEHGGGFNVWPGSHRTLFYECMTNSSSFKNKKARGFRTRVKEISKTEPVEITGGAGDVILYHFCLMHAAGINLIPGHVRQAVFCNYRTKVCRMDAPRPDNIWDGWVGIMDLGSPKIRQSMRPARSPLRGIAKTDRASVINVASMKRHLLRTPIRAHKVLRELRRPLRRSIEAIMGPGS